MRLYNLDDIEKALSIPYQENVEHIMVEYKTIPIIIEQNFKEVEAIPIDWLKKKYFNKRTIYSDRSLARQMAVKELIKEWEDESRTGD